MGGYIWFIFEFPDVHEINRTYNHSGFHCGTLWHFAQAKNVRLAEKHSGYLDGLVQEDIIPVR